MIILKPKTEFKVPVEAECISPDLFSGKSMEELKGLRILCGNKWRELGDAFDIEKTSENSEEIVISGDVSCIKHIGAGMSRGRIVIDGDVGMHLGREMKGGEIIVHGCVGDWLGAEMSGGLIRVKGDAKNLVGSGYRGSKVGMKGGTILIEGDAGHEVGELMRRGTIVIQGNMGSLAGALMTGGSIVCFGNAGERAGAGMDRGTILMFNLPELLPTFRYSCTYNPIFIRTFLPKLKNYGLPIKKEHTEGLYDRYCGDVAALGKGEILVWKGGMT